MRVITLLKSVKRVNLCLGPRKLSRKLKKQLPAWFHVGVPPNLYDQRKMGCLKNVHNAETIRHLLRIAKRATDHNSPHQPHPSCNCKDCTKDCRHGCPNPHHCSSLVRNVVEHLEPKYDPLTRPLKDGLTLTHQCKEKNQQAVIKNGDEILFDPSLTAKHNINESFRIFTDPMEISEEPAWRLQNPRQGGLPDLPIVVYTDGSCINNGKLNATCINNGKLNTTCRGGVWFRDGHPLNRAIRVPGIEQSNQAGELAALIVALQLSNTLSPLTYITDS